MLLKQKQKQKYLRKTCKHIITLIIHIYDKIIIIMKNHHFETILKLIKSIFNKQIQMQINKPSFLTLLHLLISPQSLQTT